MALNRGWDYRETVGAESAGRTLLDHLTATRTHSTPAVWTDRLQRGELEVDDVRADGDVILQAGHTVVWHRPPWDEPDVPLHFDILHEDDAVLAVVKPSGLPTMPAGGFLTHTLLTIVRARVPEARPVHRLGRFTSGIVLFAKTGEAASALSRAWREHGVEKRYRALASGVAATDSFEIDAAIGRVPHPTLGSVYAALAGAKPSHSRATVLQRRDDTTLFRVDITTGRPHQIRIHLACAGHPLVGDPLYDVGGVVRAHAPGLPGDGGYLLHAERLAFAHPMTGAPTVLQAPAPDALQCGQD